MRARRCTRTKLIYGKGSLYPIESTDCTSKVLYLRTVPSTVGTLLTLDLVCSNRLSPRTLVGADFLHRKAGRATHVAAMQSQQTLKTKEEAVALTATLQNTAESIEARCTACDQILALTKSDADCAVLCSAGGIHAVINAMKSATECEALLKGWGY